MTEPAAAALPSPLHVESSSFGYLHTAARYWAGLADRLDAAFTGTADAAPAAAAAERVRATARIADDGYRDLQRLRTAAIAAIDAARADGYTVGADYRLADAHTGAPAGAGADEHARDIRRRVRELLAADRTLAAALDAAGPQLAAAAEGFTAAERPGR